jgi:RNA polymerase sigma-70 factor (family 1)
MRSRPAGQNIDAPDVAKPATTSEPAPALTVVGGTHTLSLSADERALVAELQAGDAGAFERIFREHSAVLYAYAKQLLGAHEDAEDVVQSVFRAVWERRATWQPTVGIRAYLLTSTRNAALSVLRHVKRAEHLEGRMAETGGRPGMSAAPAAIDAALEAADLAARVESAAQELAPRCRAVFLRRWRHGLSVAETARALGIAPKTVEMQWTRAMAKIRASIERLR